MPPALFRLTSSCLLVWALLVGGSTRVAAADAGYFFEATRAFDEGRYEDVLAALTSGPLSDETRYLKARTHAALAQYTEALATLSEAPASFPQGVRDDFAVLRAEWAAAAGQCDKLMSWADAIAGERGARLKAECAFRAGDFGPAITVLASARDVPSRSLRAQALWKNGQLVEAAALARKLWIEAPAHAEVALWETIAKTQPAGVLLNTSEHMDRAEGWLSAFRTEEALKELEGLPEPTSKPERARLWHLRGEASFKSRKRYAEAAKHFAKAAALKGPTEAHDAFHAVRALSRAGEDRKAIPRYEKFAKEYPKSELAGDALYLAAWLSAREKLKDADRKLRTFVNSEEARAQPGLRRDALWDLSWLAIEANKPKDALEWLDKIPDHRQPLLNAQRSYWRAHCLLEEGARDAGKQALRDTLVADPLGWYAQLAARRLIALGEASPPAYPGAPASLTQPALRVPDDVTFYRKLGLYSDAARASERWAKTLKDRLEIAAAHSESGDAVKSHVAAEPWLSTLLKNPPMPDNLWLWRAAFPTPYEGLVHHETSRHALPATLFYGHMQVESRYKAGAVSGADAIGLMQLLPGTARSVAKGLGITVDRTTLKRPAQNIPLGASYLSGLLKRYGGQFPPAIAAYNAGTQRVDGWLAQGCPCDLDRWVERIPVEQTRNYVRRVVSSWARYHVLEAPGDPWGIALPAQVMPPTK